MHLGTLERRIRRKRFGTDDTTEDDYKDFENGLGFRPQSVRIVGSRDFQTQ